MDNSLIIGIILLGVIITFFGGSTQRKKRSKNLKGIQTYTEDGLLVKSKAEARIANFLKHKEVAYKYEKNLFLDGEILKPDFYLEKYNTYIEYYGWYDRTAKYTKRTKEKINIYKRNKIKVIGIYPKDYRNLESKMSGILIRLKIIFFINTCWQKIRKS